MVLDIDRFRLKKGGNPQEVRENQKKRFLDEGMVDKIVDADEKWIKGELHQIENYAICTSKSVEEAAI